MSSQTIVVTDHTTEFTNKREEVFVENRKVYLKRYGYKELVNLREFNWIIENLVINKGYLMDKQNNHMLTLTHPHNNVEYTLWTQTGEVEKCETVLIGEL